LRATHAAQSTENRVIYERPPRRSYPIRWWICGLLFASTVINYLDRQSLALLAPNLKTLFHWDNSDYADLVIGFRVAYTIGQFFCGRFLDRVGTRKGTTITVAFYSAASILTPLANSFGSFLWFRSLLGLGESANWPAATKAVSEWFPARERGLATAFFDSGSSLGGAIAPFLIFWIYGHWGWRPAFVVPGLLGVIWLFVWRWFYHSPERHPLISAEELSLLEKEKQASGTHQSNQPIPLKLLLRLRETWGTIAARALTDPVWFFITDWFPIYLVSKGFTLSNSLIAVWVPFLAADAGAYVSGTLSGWLIRRGWPLLRARKAIVLAGGLGALVSSPRSSPTICS
jgi:ACS family hexuronate transporter-like MFS transporter